MDIWQITSIPFNFRQASEVIAQGETSPFSSITQTYSPFGDLLARDASGGAQETYTYDAYGRLTSVSSQGGIVLSYSGFDKANRPRTLDYNLGDTNHTYTENFTFEDGGSLATIDLPTTDMTYTYDSQGRLAQASDGAHTYSYAYDEKGLLSEITYPGNLVMAYSYYEDGRPQGIELKQSTQTPASLNLTYDSYGRVNTIARDTGASDRATGTYTYTYDRTGRLSTADAPNDLPDYTYSYDPRGPLSEKNETTGSGTQTTSYAYDNAGRMTADSDGNAYTYDAAGRMTSVIKGEERNDHYTYDGLSRLISGSGSSGSATYTYDSSGRMLKRSEEKEGNTTESYFLPFAGTQETAAIYAGDASLSYSYQSDPTGTHLEQQDSDDNIRYPFRSPRSDVLALFDETGALAKKYAYEPFGEMEEGYSPEGTPFLYQDDYLDEITSFYQMQARWYDPGTALFISMDPQMGDPADPSMRSPYAYCGDDPVYKSDPTGRQPFPGPIPEIPPEWIPQAKGQEVVRQANQWEAERQRRAVQKSSESSQPPKAPVLPQATIISPAANLITFLVGLAYLSQHPFALMSEEDQARAEEFIRLLSSGTEIIQQLPSQVQEAADWGERMENLANIQPEALQQDMYLTNILWITGIIEYENIDFGWLGDLSKIINDLSYYANILTIWLPPWVSAIGLIGSIPYISEWLDSLSTDTLGAKTQLQQMGPSDVINLGSGAFLKPGVGIIITIDDSPYMIVLPLEGDRQLPP